MVDVAANKFQGMVNLDGGHALDAPTPGAPARGLQ